MGLREVVHAHLVQVGGQQSAVGDCCEAASGDGTVLALAGDEGGEKVDEGVSRRLQAVDAAGAGRWWGDVPPCGIADVGLSGVAEPAQLEAEVPD